MLKAALFTRARGGKDPTVRRWISGKNKMWYWEAGKEDGAKEKGLPPPHIRQSAYERGTQKREQALEKKKEAKVRFMM